MVKQTQTLLHVYERITIDKPSIKIPVACHSLLLLLVDCLPDVLQRTIHTHTSWVSLLHDLVLYYD